MAFVSERDQREITQNLTPYVDVPSASFSETFGASIGMVFDEQLSISGALNREGWQDRREQVQRLIAEGEIDRGRYTNRRGRFDYDRLARELGNPAIKTNAQLEEERNALLAQRRTYAEGVIERGNGMGQFLGMLNAYALDPINIAMMPIGTAGTTAKSISTMGRAMLVARNEAALATVAETFIQPIVYNHKHDIDSPWSVEDAIEGIATAAIGAGALGGALGGISGYLRNIREKTNAIKDTTPLLDAPDIDAAETNLMRMEQTLSSAPKLKPEVVKRNFVTEQLDNLRTRLADSDAVDIAPEMRSEMRILEAGEVPERLEPEFQEFSQRAQVENEANFLREVEKQRVVSNQPSRTVQMYEEPEPLPIASQATTSREREILEAGGLTQGFDETMERFAQLDAPRVGDTNGDLVDAGVVVKALDDEIAGLEDVLVCTRG